MMDVDSPEIVRKAASFVHLLGLTASIVFGVLVGIDPARAEKNDRGVEMTPFELFHYSFFEDPLSARSGLDTKVLASLTGGDRDRAEAMLIAYLPDVRGIIGLGVLRSKKAEPELRTLFKEEIAAKATHQTDWTPYALIEVAKALWLIAPDQRWLEAEVSVIASSQEPLQRMDAVIALASFRDAKAVSALTASLDDPDSLVRHHAGRALLNMHGIEEDTTDNEHMLYRVMSDDMARRTKGRADIIAAIAGRPILPSP